MPDSSLKAAITPVLPAIGKEVHRTRQRSEFQKHWSDEADRIAVRLMGRLAGRLLKIRVFVQHDGIVLEGRVRSYHAMQLVQEEVRRATERPIADNALEVI